MYLHRSAPPLRPKGWRWGSFLWRSLLLLPLAAAAVEPHGAAASGFPIRIVQPQALVLEPFGIQLGLGQRAGQAEADLLHRAGFAVTVLRDAQVTVPLMLHLSNYSFVYIETHVGPLPNNDAAVATGDTRHRRFAPYFANYSLVQMDIADSETGIYQFYDAVTGRFIHRYDGTFPPHSIIFLGSCSALDMPLFWRYLHESGISTLISWHHHVASADADRAAQYVLTALAEGRTVGQAILATRVAGAGQSVVGNKVGWLSFSGDGTNTLLQARLGLPFGLQRRRLK